MLKIAEKYNVKIQARKADTELKENMVAWLNIMKPKANYKQNKKASKCLRETHKVKTIREMTEFIEKNKNKNKGMYQPQSMHKNGKRHSRRSS